MKNMIIIFTNSFPYGLGETFLDDEIKYSSSFYEKVIIVPSEAIGKCRLTKIPANVALLISGGKMIFIERIYWSIKVLFIKYIWKEILKLIVKKTLTISKLRRIIVLSAYGERAAQNAYRYILKLLVEGECYNRNIVLYSYWLTNSAYAALRVKDMLNLKESLLVSRCHGHDIYEYRNVWLYIPFRELFFSRFDYIYPISLDGINYIKLNYKINLNKKLKLSYLGTEDYSTCDTLSKQEYFVILSCSSLISLKRVNLIIEAIAELKKNNIEWFHIGDGVLLDDLKILANQKLGNSVIYNFLGYLSHEEVISFYKNNYVNLFINTSETEGIPVSIMEAMSFGIPIIATNVGGVSEIVSDGENGFLLEKDASVQTIADTINRVMKLSTENYNNYRSKSRDIWEKKFNANLNYTAFFTDLLKEVSNKK